jgi:hypothetical protein
MRILMIIQGDTLMHHAGLQVKFATEKAIKKVITEVK